MLKLYLNVEISDYEQFSDIIKRYDLPDNYRALRTILRCVHEDCFPGTIQIPEKYKNLAEDVFRCCKTLHTDMLRVGPELIINKIYENGVISICLPS